MRLWPGLGILLLQTFLLLAHWFIFHTVVSFFALGPYAQRNLAIALFILAISFVTAALLGYRYTNPAVELIYKIAAVWLGMLNFIFWGSCLCWIVALGASFDGEGAQVRWITASIVYAAAILVSIYGMLNARYIRRRHVDVALPRLPEAWRGRSALLISDMHLGNVNGAGFARRIARIAQHLNPDIVFIAGDLFDGSKVHPERVAAPMFDVKPPFGVFFCGGNHEDFGDPEAYEAALTAGGIRVLHNERVDVEGLQIVGVSYSAAQQGLKMRAFLDSLRLIDAPASILLNHVPARLPLVDYAGVSLQLSGHTHGGQIVPFTWLTRRIFGKYTYGLQRYGNLQVLTSSGVGTWGPPMRVGTEPEVVLIRFV